MKKRINEWVEGSYKGKVFYKIFGRGVILVNCLVFENLVVGGCS